MSDDELDPLEEAVRAVVQFRPSRQVEWPTHKRRARNRRRNKARKARLRALKRRGDAA